MVPPGKAAVLNPHKKDVFCAALPDSGGWTRYLLLHLQSLSYSATLPALFQSSTHTLLHILRVKLQKKDIVVGCRCLGARWSLVKSK